MSVKHAIRLVVIATTFVTMTASVVLANVDAGSLSDHSAVEQEGTGSLTSGNVGLVVGNAPRQAVTLTQTAQSGTTRRRHRATKPRRVRSKRTIANRSSQITRTNRFACTGGGTEDCSQQSEMDAKRDHDYVGNYNFKVELD